MNKENIGKRIKKIRTQSGFNQTIIAQYLQIDQSMVSKIENGEREASTDVLKKLAELFGCKIGAFLEEDEQLVQLNVAFRSNGLVVEDLKAIATINRIALNLENMQQVLEEQDEEYTRN